MRRTLIGLAAAGLLAAAAHAATVDGLADQIYKVAQTKPVNTSIPDWNGKAVVFAGKLWIAPDETTAPMVTIPAAGGSFVQVVCAAPLADPPKGLKQDDPVQISGTISDVDRRDANLKGTAGFLVLALSGGMALFSGPAVVVELDHCALAAKGA